MEQSPTSLPELVLHVLQAIVPLEDGAEFEGYRFGEGTQIYDESTAVKILQEVPRPARIKCALINEVLWIEVQAVDALSHMAVPLARARLLSAVAQSGLNRILILSRSVKRVVSTQVLQAFDQNVEIEGHYLITGDLPEREHIADNVAWVLKISASSSNTVVTWT